MPTFIGVLLFLHVHHLHHRLSFLALMYLHSSVVAALLHVQQSAALASCPELDLQAAGPCGVRGHALQWLSQEDVTFGALLQGVVQTAGAIQGQSRVRRHVCGGKNERISSILHWRFTGDCKTNISTWELAEHQAKMIFQIRLPLPQIGSCTLTGGYKYLPIKGKCRSVLRTTALPFYQYSYLLIASPKNLEYDLWRVFDVILCELQTLEQIFMHSLVKLIFSL